MGCGLDSRCVGRVYGVDGAVRLSSSTDSFGTKHKILAIHFNVT